MLIPSLALHDQVWSYPSCLVTIVSQVCCSGKEVTSDTSDGEGYANRNHAAVGATHLMRAISVALSTRPALRDCLILRRKVRCTWVYPSAYTDLTNPQEGGII
jgi:hypothetical protein